MKAHAVLSCNMGCLVISSGSFPQEQRSGRQLPDQKRGKRKTPANATANELAKTLLLHHRKANQLHNVEFVMTSMILVLFLQPKMHSLSLSHTRLQYIQTKFHFSLQPSCLASRRHQPRSTIIWPHPSTVMSIISICSGLNSSRHVS